MYVHTQIDYSYFFKEISFGVVSTNMQIKFTGSFMYVTCIRLVNLIILCMPRTCKHNFFGYCSHTYTLESPSRISFVFFPTDHVHVKRDILSMSKIFARICYVKSFDLDH
jgi:hypothetical protein